VSGASRRRKWKRHERGSDKLTTVASDSIEGPSEVSLGSGKGAASREPPLGGFLVETRKRRGLSAEDVVRQTRIPAHYVRMIESTDYRLIADQLYLLPFLRRYASFLGLEAEEVAMRFIREVQRADSNAARMPDPIPVVEPAKRRIWVTAVVAAAATFVVATIGYVALLGRLRRPVTAVPSASADLSQHVSAAASAASAMPTASSGASASSSLSEASAAATPSPLNPRRVAGDDRSEDPTAPSNADQN
jgi:cytoskeleton protein RodZ